MIPEEKERGAVSSTTYYRYFRAGGSLLTILFVFASLFFGEVSMIGDFKLFSYVAFLCNNLYAIVEGIGTSALMTTQELIEWSLIACKLNHHSVTLEWLSSPTCGLNRTIRYTF
jgi:hypothetical protein